MFTFVILKSWLFKYCIHGPFLFLFLVSQGQGDENECLRPDVTLPCLDDDRGWLQK